MYNELELRIERLNTPGVLRPQVHKPVEEEHEPSRCTVDRPDVFAKREASENRGLFRPVRLEREAERRKGPRARPGWNLTDRNAAQVASAHAWGEPLKIGAAAEDET